MIPASDYARQEVSRVPNFAEVSECGGVASVLPWSDLWLAASSSSAGMYRPLTILIPKDEWYYWSEEWQRNERIAESELRAGNSRTFDSADDAIAWLHSNVEAD